MFDIRKINQLKKESESLYIKYDLFYSNRLYKNTHFKTEDEYVIIQRNLSSEIEFCEKRVKDIIRLWLKENFEKVVLVEFDSRFICFNRNKKRIGKVLVKNAYDINLRKKIQDSFLDDFEFEIIIESFEELPKEVQEKFTK